MLTDYLDPKRIIIASHFDDYDALLKKMLEHNTTLQADDAVTRIKKRDTLMPTALGKGVALPRALFPELELTEVHVALLERGLSLIGFDIIPVRLIILFLCSRNDDYPSLIAQSIKLCADDNFRSNALKCKDSNELISLFRDREYK